MTPIYAHLDAARKIIDATASATVRDSKSPGKALAHIDAAQHLVTAAVELFGAAADIASGRQVRGHGAALGPDANPLAISLRIAEAKLGETQRMLEAAAA